MGGAIPHVVVFFDAFYSAVLQFSEIHDLDTPPSAYPDYLPTPYSVDKTGGYLCVALN
jgi:hypothetical protein